jgi:electron-transferring-flavoprotein dehydrogenase
VVAPAVPSFPKRVEQSYIKKELWAVRNFHQSFKYGLYGGLFHTALQFVTGGRGLIDPMRIEA